MKQNLTILLILAKPVLVVKITNQKLILLHLDHQKLQFFKQNSE